VIEIGDLVEWAVLTIHPNDIPILFDTVRNGKTLDHLLVGNLTTIVKHTGLISNINDFDITVIDFVEREETIMRIEDANYKLTILNKK
jgi:hypothetical protein